MTACHWLFVLLLVLAVTPLVAAQPLGTDVIACDWNGAVYRVPASGPMICAPRMRSVSLSAMILTKPSAWNTALARALPMKGNLPTL